MENIGKPLIIVGVVIVLAGLFFWLLGDKLSFLGRLPGDVRIESEQVKIYVPFTTMLLLSALLSVIMWLINRFR